MTRLLHISDVHIGKAFAVFGNKAPRLREAQLLTLRNVAKIGRERGVSAVLVSGDLFDSNTVGELLNDVQTIICESGLKFYVLPGAGERGIAGHDALEPGSVYYRDSWSGAPNAFIFTREGGEVFYDVTSGIAFYGKPTRHGESPLPLIEKHKEARYHVALTHGSVRLREEFADYPIEPRDIAASGFDYIALGHWHQTSDFSSGKTCAWYPGSPEILEADRTGKGCALLIALHGQGPASVEIVEVGKFLWARADVDAASDPASIADSLLAKYPDPELTILKVRLAGSAKSEDVARLKEIITEKLTGMFDLTFDTSRVMEEIDLSKYPEDSVIGQFVRIMNDKIREAGVDDRHHLDEALRLGIGLMTGNMDRKSINLEDLLR